MVTFKQFFTSLMEELSAPVSILSATRRISELTPEEVLAVREYRRKAMAKSKAKRLAKQLADPEYIKAKLERQKEMEQLAMSRRERKREAARKRWYSLSQDERKRRARENYQKQRKRFESLSPEEQAAIRQAHSDSQMAYARRKVGEMPMRVRPKTQDELDSMQIDTSNIYYDAFADAQGKKSVANAMAKERKANMLGFHQNSRTGEYATSMAGGFRKSLDPEKRREIERMEREMVKSATKQALATKFNYFDANEKDLIKKRARADYWARRANGEIKEGFEEFLLSNFDQILEECNLKFPTFKRFISESIIDPMRKTLDNTVFSNPEDDQPTIDPFIKAQIESAIQVFNQVAPVHDYYLVGSILGKHYNDRSDLDVTVEILKDDVDEATEEKLYGLLKKMNGQNAHNSTHPINYHFNFVDEDEDLSDNFDNIYDIDSGSWKKQTEDRYIDPEEFMDEFDERIQEIDLNAMEIRRDIIDIDMLKSMPKEEIEGLTEMVEAKLEEIESDIEAMLDLEDGIADERREAFKNVTPSELKELGSKNALPINIIYKLMERYYYMDLIKTLGDILHEDDEIEQEDIPEIKKAFRDFDEDFYDDMEDVTDKMDR